MDNSLTIILAAFLGIFLISQVVKRLKQIKPEKAKKLIESGAVIIDVRQPAEYHSGHIKQAINIPLDSINKVIKRLDKEKEIIVYCQTGGRSSAAYKKLKAMGYTNVYDLGGIGAWPYEKA